MGLCSKGVVTVGVKVCVWGYGTVRVGVMVRARVGLESG